MRSNRTPTLKRYWSKVRKRNANQCWPWLGSQMKTGGYAQFYIQNDSAKSGLRTYGAHRLAYEIAYGPVPNGRSVMHICNMKTCQNPRHLRLTPVRGGYRSRATHCKHGHEYTPKNTAYNPKTSAKICRACNRARQDDYRARKQLATVTTPPLIRRPVSMAY